MTGGFSSLAAHGSLVNTCGCRCGVAASCQASLSVAVIFLAYILHHNCWPFLCIRDASASTAVAVIDAELGDSADRSKNAEVSAPGNPSKQLPPSPAAAPSRGEDSRAVLTRQPSDDFVAIDNPMRLAGTTAPDTTAAGSPVSTARGLLVDMMRARGPVAHTLMTSGKGRPRSTTAIRTEPRLALEKSATLLRLLAASTSASETHGVSPVPVSAPAPTLSTPTETETKTADSAKESQQARSAALRKALLQSVLPQATTTSAPLPLSESSLVQPAQLSESKLETPGSQASSHSPPVPTRSVLTTAPVVNTPASEVDPTTDSRQARSAALRKALLRSVLPQADAGTVSSAPMVRIASRGQASSAPKVAADRDAVADSAVNTLTSLVGNRHSGHRRQSIGNLFTAIVLAASASSPVPDQGSKQGRPSLRHALANLAMWSVDYNSFEAAFLISAVSWAPPTVCPCPC